MQKGDFQSVLKSVALIKSLVINHLYILIQYACKNLYYLNTCILLKNISWPEKKLLFLLGNKNAGTCFPAKKFLHKLISEKAADT